MFYDSNPWVFAIIDLNQHAFLGLKGVTPTFSILGTMLKSDIKNCPLLGELKSVWRTVSVLPKSAQSAKSAQTVENSHSFFNVSYTWYKSLGEPMFTVNGPWGSQPCTEKKLIVNSEQLFRAGFSCFLRQIIFSFFTL